MSLQSQLSSYGTKPFAKSIKILVAILGISLVAIVGVPAVAHEAGEAHANEDLAGTSVSEIEQQTNKVKAQKKAATGVEPGAARTQSTDGSARTFALRAVPSDPAQSGQWSPVYAAPLVPVFQAVLPNGKILAWDSVGDKAAEHTAVHNSTRAMVWNPTNNTYKRVDVVGSNIFCAGFAHLPNGDILVAGGNKNADLAGTVETHIFNWRSETWSRGRDMAAGRWYPSVTNMANGELVIIGGGPATAEAYQTNGQLRSLTGFTNKEYGGRIYPFAVSRPDTLLQLVGPYATNYTLNIPGKSVITATSERDTIDRQYGSFATYDIGKTLVVGGGSVTENGKTKVPTATAVIEDMNKPGAPTITKTGSLSIGRRQHNATVLADGSVLVTGGLTSTAKSGTVDLDNAVTSAELWNPATGTWTVQSSASRIRQYHSAAALLTDGRVITGGGGICGQCETEGYLEKNFEYFTPSYLYKKDGSGQLAERPTIATVPSTITINSTFALTSPQSKDITKVALIGMADVTHSTDGNQRYVPLKFQTTSNGLSVTSPATGGITPPGYYMLVVVDKAGVPSVAKVVTVAKAQAPDMSPIKNVSAGRCIDIPNATIAIKTNLQSYNCNGTVAQAMTRLANDATVRANGNCLDVYDARFVTGTKVWMYRCNNTVAQKWRFDADGTIRPLQSPKYCLSAVSNTNKAAIQIKTCNGSTLQKWTY